MFSLRYSIHSVVGIFSDPFHIRQRIQAQCGRENTLLAGNSTKLLWIHTKASIAYPSRIFKSTIFHPCLAFSYLIYKKRITMPEDQLQIKQGQSHPRPAL